MIINCDLKTGLCRVLKTSYFSSDLTIRGRCRKNKSKKKLTSVSFMYVCVAENAKLLVFFTFFILHLPLSQVFCFGKNLV